MTRPSRGAPDADSTAAAPLIEFRGVSKRFGAFTALDAVDLTIAKGEFFALLGPSGCGKTTLLRTLAGFEQPSAGSVALAGVDLAGMPPHRRPVNLMFQSYALFPHMSVESNIAFGLKMEGMRWAAVERRVAAMLELVQLSGLGKRMPHQISGGQRQRVALARALAKQPTVLLLDEPMSALDRKLRGETRLELTRIQRELGITFVLVTHDQEEALSLSDRIAVMNRGRIEQVGTPKDIYERPASRYVAGFVGTINLLETHVSGRCGAGIALDFAGTSIIHACETPAEVGARLCLALRPEELAIAPGGLGNAPDDNRIAGILVDIAYLGERSLCSVAVAGGRPLQISVGGRQSDAAAAPGTPVDVVWRRGAGILLER